MVLNADGGGGSCDTVLLRDVFSDVTTVTSMDKSIVRATSQYYIEVAVNQFHPHTQTHYNRISML